MSVNLYGTYCIFSAKESEYDCNIIIRSHFFVIDVYYVFIKNWIKEKEIYYSLPPQNIKLKFASKCQSFSKFENKYESTIWAMWWNVFKLLFLRESK